MGRSARAVVAVLALVPVLLAGCAHAASAARGPAAARLPDCGGDPQVRPAEVVVICSVNSIDAGHLTWSAWGKPVAVGLGSAVVDLCAYEDCHTGTFSSYPIVLIASKMVSCTGGIRSYSRLQYTFVGNSPFQGVPATMKIPQSWVGSSRPTLGNQVVSRPCR
jgi:hypothetical protein